MNYFQHKHGYQTMNYSAYPIDWLNDIGFISSAFLMRRLKIDYEEAIRILQSIVDEHTNVKFISKGLIAIDGREPIKEKKLNG